MVGLSNIRVINFFSVRYGYIQLKIDKKRLRKKGKVLKKSRENVYERVLYLLRKGRLLDYTHPSEVDHYMRLLYILFEYLTITEYILKREFIYSQMLHKRPLSKEDVKIFVKTVMAINKVRRRTLFYLLNGIKPIMGAVVKNKFYGKRRYWQELFTLFTDTFLENINKLRYNPDKTRMSIYCYQSFWLAGLTTLKKFETEEEKYVRFPDYYSENRGLKMLSVDDEFYDNIIGEEIKIHENNEEDNNENIDSQDNEFNYDDNKEEIHEEALSIEKDFTEDVHSNIDHEKLSRIISKILFKLKIDPNDLYKMNDKKIQELGKRIRKAIKKGKIELTQEELNFLKSYIGLSI